MSSLQERRSQVTFFAEGFFGFFNNTSLPKMEEKEQLRTYHGWVHACTNAIAERVVDIDLKLQTKNNPI